MKRYRLLPLLLLTALLLSACGSDRSAAKPFWYVDRDVHYQLNSDMQEVQKGEHTVEGSVCTVCGVEFSAQEDGEVWLQLYDEGGALTLWMVYDEDGELTRNSRWTYTYDESGRLSATREDRFGAPWQETTYDESGAPASITLWQEDGTRLLSTYDGDKLVGETLYDGDTALYHYDVICEYNRAGQITTQRRQERGLTVSETVYTYAADGQLTGKKVFVHGRLTQEDIYRQVDGEWKLTKTTTYRNDGTTSTVDYSKLGDLLDNLLG